MSDNQVIAAKTLLVKAHQQLSRTGLERAFALLHLHDALDWIMQYLRWSKEHKKSEATFKNHARYISENEDEFGVFNMTYANELDDMRNQFKHSFVMPNDVRLSFLAIWVEDQINSLLLHYLNKTLLDFDMLRTVAFSDVASEINQADESFRDKKMQDATHHIAVAFDMVICKVENTLGDYFSNKPSFSADFSFDSAFFLKINDLGKMIGEQYKLGDSWDKIIHSIEYLNMNALVNTLGLNIRDYNRFRQWTPKPQKALSGKYHSYIMPRLHENLKNMDYDFCREFVIQVAINASDIVDVHEKMEARETAI